MADEHDPPPPSSVIEGFGLHGEPAPLAGGQGHSWRVGNAVLKPCDQPLDALTWQGAVLPTLARDGAVRMTWPMRALDGTWTVGGWTASPFLAGAPATGHWTAVVAAGRAFHELVADQPRPAFLDGRHDPWSVGDRVAWQEAEPPCGPAVLHRLLAALDDASTAGPAQLVHGDLTGNVLLHPELPPAVIDLSLYWRPVEYASAVVVADALLWHGADRRLFDLSTAPCFPDLVCRALVARLVTDLERDGALDQDRTTRYERAAAEVGE